MVLSFFLSFSFSASLLFWRSKSVCLFSSFAFSGSLVTYLALVFASVGSRLAALLIVKFKQIKDKKKKILKAVPCQRATNLFDVGLKASIFIKRGKKIWRNFLLDLEQKYFDLDTLRNIFI